MAGINKVILVGNLGKDPELSYSAAGLAVAKFSLATTERIKDEDKTEWHRIITFGKLAEICGQYLTKGKQVYIEGRIQTNEWTDKEGVKRWTTEIICNTIQMLGSKGDSGGAPPVQRPAESAGPGPAYNQGQADDDIPF